MVVPPPRMSQPQVQSIFRCTGPQPDHNKGGSLVATYITYLRGTVPAYHGPLIGRYPLQRSNNHFVIRDAHSI
jgi:hypothetical protein